MSYRAKEGQPCDSDFKIFAFHFCGLEHCAHKCSLFVDEEEEIFLADI